MISISKFIFFKQKAIKKQKALRCIHYKTYYDSVRELKTQKIKILDVKSLYLYEIRLFMFKFNNNLLPDKFKNYNKSVKNVYN